MKIPGQFSVTINTRGATEKEISAYVSLYNKNQLVNELLEQCLIPSWILNQEYYQKAVNVQVDLMMNANSEKVRAEAANSLLTHLKRPEVKKAELSIDITNRQVEDDLSSMLDSLVQKQKELLAAGVVTSDIAAQQLGKPLEEPNQTTLDHIEDAEIIYRKGRYWFPTNSVAKRVSNSSLSTKT